jgi:two-component system sensor histidine kinase PilS (NtrC family)
MQDTTPESFRNKLIWVMLFRIVVVSILLFATIMKNIRNFSSIIRFESTFFILIIILAYLASLVYLYLLKNTKWYRASAISQIIGDIVFSTALCYFSGKDGSIFTIFFAFSIIIASILFSRVGAYITAAISSVIILIFALDRQFLFLPYIVGMIIDSSRPPLDQLIYSLFIHILAYTVIAQLSSYLSTELKTTSEKYYAQKRDYTFLFERYKAIVENLSDGVLLFRNNHLVYINDIAAALFSVNAQNIDDSVSVRLREILENLKPTSGGEIQSLNGKEKRFITLRHKRKIYEDGTTDDVYVISDLTEGRRLQEEIIRAERLASIGKVATGFAHEIRNPLSSILGSIELIKKGRSLNQEDAILMDIVIKELLRVNELIERFLMFARPAPPKFKEIDLQALIKEVIELIRFDRDYKDGIRFEINDGFKKNIEADESMMKQVFWNLFKNSIQAIKGDGSVSISLRDAGDGINLLVTVTDTGCGISPSELDRVFDPFYTTKDKSTGIGLSLVYSIIREHRGSISVDSTAGEGTTFRILLPIRQRGE